MNTSSYRRGLFSIIREFSAIQKPAYEDLTSIGDHVFIMQSVHIPHDANIQDHVTITPIVALAGLTRILRGVFISMGATIHQRCVVGHYSIVGMGASVLKNIKPFLRYIPDKKLTVNKYAIKKFGFNGQTEEIVEYVLQCVSPQTKELLNIYREFTRLCEKSTINKY